MVEARRLAAFAAAFADPDLAVPPGLSARPGTDPVRRFAVYRNNVVTGLVEALCTGFPVTARIVGEAFFRSMARAFVAACKPGSPLLFEYGSVFPEFVAGFAPAASVPHLSGVAALEAARTQAFHAAEAPALGPAALAVRLAGRPGDAMLAARVVAHPAARLVASPYPVASIWAVHQDGGADPVFAGPWRPETALVTRPAGEVRVRALDAAGGVFATALLAGTGVGEAGAASLGQDGEFDIGGALVALADAGAIGDLTGTME